MKPNTKESIGKITTTLSITNRLDQGKSEDGLISPEQVWSITLNNVLIDTGVTILCLPADAIAPRSNLYHSC